MIAQGLWYLLVATHELYKLDKNKWKKKNSLVFLLKLKTDASLKLHRHEKAKKKTKKQKTPQKTENSALAILNDSQAFLYQHVNVSYLTIL